MFVVFEGIDGSGKTTISNKVGQALRAAGLRVSHVREGGKFASSVTQSLRDFGRDARNLDLAPSAELLLYAAREAQILDEVIRPALGATDVVIADRFLSSAEVLARFGRGLPPAQVQPVIAAAGHGVTPDLVVLIDVDPHVARARRRIAKIVTPDPRPPSRKGQGGAGLLQRMRDGYRELAAGDPGRWIVLDNSWRPLQETVDLAIDVVLCAHRGGVAEAVARHRAAAPRPGAASEPLRPEDALPALLRWVDRCAADEPALALYMMAGLSGPPIEVRRRALCDRAPELAAFGLRGLGDRASWRLREQLVARAPRHVARSLAPPTPDGPDKTRVRQALFVETPADVIASTEGLDDAESWALRDVLCAEAPDAVMASLATLSGARAWAVRDRWLSVRGAQLSDSYAAALTACRSVTGLDDDRAWAVRTPARAAAPLAALASLAGLASDRAWLWREKNLDGAARTVLWSLRGLDQPQAWAMRQAAAPRCKEALDSMIGLGGATAWRIREACADLWPGAVAKSLGPLGTSERSRDLCVRLLSRHPDDISLLRHAAALAMPIAAASEAMAA